jgi:hypothetical protein
MEVKIKKARVSFPFLHKQDDEGKFRAALILDPATPEGKQAITDIEAAMAQVKTAKWGAKVPPKLKISCLKDGDAEGRPEFAGKMLCQASNTVQPGLYDSDGSVLDALSGKPYGGCYVHAIVDVHAWDNTNGKGVRASLQGVKFAAHGDAFAGGTKADVSAFDGFGDDEFEI